MSNFTKKQIDNALRVVQLKLKLMMIGNNKAKFNMSHGFSEYCDVSHNNCGTVGCIGGYADIELGGDGQSVLNFSNDRRSALNKLFFPTGYGRGVDDEWKLLTPKQAISAIQNYLDGKADPWKGVAKRNTSKDYLENQSE